MHEVMDRARREQGALLRCIVPWTSKDGVRSRLVVDGKALHAQVLTLARVSDTGLHSSASASLIVAVEETLKSWVGLHLEWIRGERKMPKPSFPTMPPGTAKLALARWNAALDGSGSVMTLAGETRWRAEVMRAAQGTLLPMYFGAATSGVTSQAHCGLIRREDGKLFALLTLWGQGSPLGAPVTRARNRTGAGSLANVRAAAGGKFAPTSSARCSILCPLMFARGHESLFLSRAIPKSAELVKRDDGFYLHVAFEFPEHAPRELTGAVLSLRRGIATLVAGVVVGENGAELETVAVEGKALASLVTNIRALRAAKQAQGRVLAGDRRQARVVEHHLYSAAHQVIDLACRRGAEIVLLADPEARRPLKFLAWKHFHQFFEILTQLAAEAGLPPPRERKIYGPWSTCLECGWTAKDPVRLDPAALVAGQCGACGSMRNSDFHLARLLAQDTLRLRANADGKIPLPEYIRRGKSLTT